MPIKFTTAMAVWNERENICLLKLTKDIVVCIILLDLTALFNSPQS